MSRLFDCVQRSDVEGVKKLLNKGANPNVKNKDGKTPLCLISQNTYDVNTEQIFILLLKAGANPNIKDNAGLATLHYLSLCNPNIRLAKILLKFGADPNLRCDYCGETPLGLICSFKRSVEFVKLLVKFGADVYGENDAGKTVLDLAKIKVRSGTCEYSTPTQNELISLLESYMLDIKEPDCN